MINVLVKGVAKHASIPEGSLNAALVASELLLDCSFVSANDKCILEGAKNMLSCHYGRGMGVDHTDPVFGRTTCVNGLCKTRNGKLCLSFDIRYGSTQSPTELERAGDESLEKYGFIPFEKDNRPGFSIDESSPYPAIFEEIYAEITGERLGRVTMAGGTYARKLTNAFSVGTYVIRKDRATPVFEMPEGHGGAHQCDECIDIEGFFEAVLCSLLLEAIPYLRFENRNLRIIMDNPLPDLNERWNTIIDIEDWTPRHFNNSITALVRKVEDGCGGSDGKDRLYLTQFNFQRNLGFYHTFIAKNHHSMYRNQINDNKRYNKDRHCCVFIESSVLVAEEM